MNRIKYDYILTHYNYMNLHNYINYFSESDYSFYRSLYQFIYFNYPHHLPPFQLHCPQSHGYRSAYYFSALLHPSPSSFTNPSSQRRDLRCSAVCDRYAAAVARTGSRSTVRSWVWPWSDSRTASRCRACGRWCRSEAAAGPPEMVDVTSRSGRWWRGGRIRDLVL